jgi:hypothetical protein
MFVKGSKYEHQKATGKGKSSKRAQFMNFSLPEIRTFFSFGGCYEQENDSPDH